MTREDIIMFTEESEVKIPFFDNPSYDTAIIGLSINDEVVYDYDLMIEYLTEQDDFTVEDAIEFIEYNTIRALSRFGVENKLIIIRTRL